MVLHLYLSSCGNFIFYSRFWCIFLSDLYTELKLLLIITVDPASTLRFSSGNEENHACCLCDMFWCKAGLPWIGEFCWWDGWPMLVGRYQRLGRKLSYLHCISNGDMIVLYQAIHMVLSKWEFPVGFSYWWDLYICTAHWCHLTQRTPPPQEGLPFHPNLSLRAPCLVCTVYQLLLLKWVVQWELMYGHQPSSLVDTPPPVMWPSSSPHVFTWHIILISCYSLIY